MCFVLFDLFVLGGISVGDTPHNNEVGYKFLAPFLFEGIKQNKVAEEIHKSTGLKRKKLY